MLRLYCTNEQHQINRSFSKVNAIDIYPADVAGPDNLKLGTCNLNEGVREWGFPPNHFDLINSRFLAPGISKTRWRSYVQDLARLLKRNGWLQMVEWGYLIQSDSGLLPGNSYCLRWNDLYRQALDGTKDLRVGQRMRDLMQRAGLGDIQTYQYQIPIGPWKAGMPTVIPFSYISFSKLVRIHSSFSCPSIFVLSILKPREQQVGIRREVLPRFGGWWAACSLIPLTLTILLFDVDSS